MNEPLNAADLDISRVVVSREAIDERIDVLASELTARFEGREVTVLTVLTGALVFTADLVRKMRLKVRIEPVSIRSYPGTATRAQQAEFRLPPSEDLAGRDVLIVDDILDSGQTLLLLTERVARMAPASIASCVLLRKNRPDIDRPIEADLTGFDIPDEFVVGYGLDFDGAYRNLPYIGVLAEHART